MSAMTLSFIDHLEAQLRDCPPKQKGQRTRERLKIATARILEQKGYHAMRVTDVTESAEVAEGSFYVYFKDKTDASLTVLTSLLDHFFALHMDSARGQTAFGSIRATNRKWIAVCRANSGLMRCIFQLGDEAPEFAQLSQRTNRSWYQRVSESVIRQRHGLEEGPVLLIVYMLGAMMDELVRKLIVYPDPEFHSLLGLLGMDDDAVADAASLVWLRILHPDAPRPDLPDDVGAVSQWMFNGPATLGTPAAWPEPVD